MTDVFISYKRRLRPRVQSIATALAGLGLDVWFDAELEPGTSFSAEISNKVRVAKCVLVCWSDDAFPHGGDENGWVLGEATIGRSRKVLVSAMLEPTDFDPPWNIVHSEDLTGWNAAEPLSGRANWQNILLAIGRHTDRPGLAEYDRARATQTTRALRSWLKAFPDDPLAASAQRTLNSRKRTPRLKPIGTAPSTTVGQATGAVTIEGTAIHEVGPRGYEHVDAPPQAVDVDAIERALHGEGTTETSNEKEALEEWLARDEALTADLSFERTKLEDAVAEALSVDGPLASPVEQAVVPGTRPPPQLSQDQMESDIHPPHALQMLLAGTAGVVMSAGAFFLAVSSGFVNTPLGNILAVVVCPALYGVAIVLPGYWLSRLRTSRAILIVLIVPALAVCSGAVSTIVYAVSPGVFGEAAYGAVGSVIGAFVLMNVLVATGAIRERDWHELLVMSLLVAVAPTLIEVSPFVGISTADDAAWVMLAWEVCFSFALVALSAMEDAAMRGADDHQTPKS